MDDNNSVALWVKIDGIEALTELAFNLHWSWNHEADWLWRRLDADLWETTQNPWLIIHTVSRSRIESALSDPEFRESVDTLLAKHRTSYRQPAWFQNKFPDTKPNSVAYFSMEFMLTEALPIYSGGLGNVAGDQMKAASDLGVPVVGIGLLYGQGYFRQDFDSDGKQKVLYPISDPGQLPIRPLRNPDGEWLRLQIEMPGAKMWVRCWEVAVGRTMLYLLDTNDLANSAAQRGITCQLYGGDAEMRLQQEIVLGIAGWRLLRAIGLRPEVCHLNEGHAAFAVLERARSYMEDAKCSFELALNITRAGNVFTTHTAVAAGFDRFELQLIRKYLTHYAQDELAISIDQLSAMGKENAEDTADTFNMAYLAVHGSCRVNGVSELHGDVSRRIFQPLFPRWPQDEVPIGSVTNGIHVPTWDSAAADALWTELCGKTRWLGENLPDSQIHSATDSQLWQMRNDVRRELIGRLRKRYARQTTAQGRDASEFGGILSDDALTLGFARRFATYKRPNLLLHDPERLLRLLRNPNRPVQLVLAGKAHPQDLPGQALIEQWNDFIDHNDVRSQVIFLSDYDMLMAQELVSGIDLWINTPRRPWEACGTSGMKVLSNGGLNLSELDGWWAEAYAPEVGWAIGDGQEHGVDSALDAQEADAMYTLLEDQVVPEFYDRSEGGLPHKWLDRIRESMTRLTQRFSASRAIQDYTEMCYLPATLAYLERSTADGAIAQSLITWNGEINEHWSSLRLGSMEIEEHDDKYRFNVKVMHGRLDPGALKVELYASTGSGTKATLETMSVCKDCESAEGFQTYSVSLAAVRPASDYTVRIIPYNPRASVPLEADQILWQH